MNPEHKGKIAVLVPGIPRESIGASVVLFYRYMEVLKELAHPTLNILVVQRQYANEDHLRQYREAFHSEALTVEAIVCDKIVIENTFSRPYLNAKLAREIVEKLEIFNPDIVLCFDIACAWLVSEISSKIKIVWLGDLNFKTYWYHVLYSVKERAYPLIKVPPIVFLTWLRCRRWKKIYHDVLSHTDIVIVSSKSSEKHMADMKIKATYLPYPWPCRSEPLDAGKAPLPDIPTFLFYGTLRALGSISSFHFMIDKLYPSLTAIWGRGGFRILVAGIGELYPWVEEAFKKKPEFEFVGFVDNLEELMRGCHAVIAPIDIPVGNRSRILTAMANRVLVIAHRNTSMANPDLEDGKTCLLASTADEFAGMMKQAFVQRSEMETIIRQAHAMYLRKFHPEAAKAIFKNHIVDCLSMIQGEYS